MADKTQMGFRVTVHVVADEGTTLDEVADHIARALDDHSVSPFAEGRRLRATVVAPADELGAHME